MEASCSQHPSILQQYKNPAELYKPRKNTEPVHLVLGSLWLCALFQK